MFETETEEVQNLKTGQQLDKLLNSRASQLIAIGATIWIIVTKVIIPISSLESGQNETRAQLLTLTNLITNQAAEFSTLQATVAGLLQSNKDFNSRLTKVEAQVSNLK